jgi:two-component system, NtrC family, sensor kinase
MLWYTVNYAIGTCLSLSLGLFVLFWGESNQPVRRSWCALCVNVGLWHAGKFLLVSTADVAVAQLAVNLIYFGAILIPPVYLHFVLALLDEQKIFRALIVFTYAVALAEFFFLLNGFLVSGVTRSSNFGYYEIPGPAYWLYFANYILLPGFALWRLVRTFVRNDGAVKKNQLKYVIFSSSIGFLTGVTSFLPFVSTWPPVGAPLVYFYTLPITYAVARYRLMDIDVVIKKSLVYALILLMLVLPCYLLLIYGQRLAFDEINYRFSFASLLLFMVVGFLYPKLRFRTEEALEKVLFKKRVNYHETLLHSSQDMVSIVDIKVLSEKLVQTIGKSLRIEKVSLLLSNESKGSYNLEASVGLEFEHPERILLSRDGPLIKLLRQRREPMVKEELEWVPVGPETPQTIETMDILGAEISLPIISKDKLIGILNLGLKEDKSLYSDEDLELLSTLANQAAIAIENARLYENLKQSQVTLRRADRLSSLGLLTAGLAHEIRNPLVAIRTFTQLLPERYEDAEFRNGFQGLALKEVDRICGLINDLLSFARPSKPNVAPENINDVVDNIVRILEAQAKEKGIVIVREFTSDLPKAWIDREQMKQVFMNLIINAIQAMNGEGSIKISTREIDRRGSAPIGQFIQVEVRDSGVGIPEENLDHIFDPFFTSGKEEGSGLGLAVSHQIVQEHGGFVTVESKLGQGTGFFVHVPVGAPVRAAVNGTAHANEANLSH